MWARVATFEGGDFEQMKEEGRRRLQEGGGPEGMRGTLVLADTDRSRRLFVTFFDSREAIDEAESQFEQMGDEIPEEVRGRRVSRDYYEVVFSQVPETTTV